MSADMYREMLREKWEAEQQEILDKQDTVHYANVRFDGKENFARMSVNDEHIIESDQSFRFMIQCNR